MVGFLHAIAAIELLRKSVEVMVRCPSLGSRATCRLLTLLSPPPSQFSIANQTRSKAWVLQQMGTLTAEIDAFQHNLPTE